MDRQDIEQALEKLRRKQPDRSEDLGTSECTSVTNVI